MRQDIITTARAAQGTRSAMHLGRVEEAAANVGLSLPATDPIASTVLKAVTERQQWIEANAAEAASIPPLALPQSAAHALLQAPTMVAIGVTKVVADRELAILAGANRSINPNTTHEAKVLIVPVQLDGTDLDDQHTEAVALAVKEHAATWLLLGEDLRVGRDMQEALDAIQRKHGVVIVEPGTASTVARILQLTKAFADPTPVSICHAFNSGRFGLNLRARIDGNAVRVRDIYNNELLALAQTGDGWAINDRAIKPNTAIVAAANRTFAPGGDTLISVINPASVVSLALSLLAQAMQDSYRPKDTIYGWLKGLDMVFMPIARELVKLDAAGQVYNRDNVLGHLRIVTSRDSDLRAEARCQTSGLVHQLTRTVPGTVFLPAAKGDFIMAFDADRPNLVNRTPEGQITLAAKGTKHLDGFHAQTAGRVTLPAVILPGTPICSGGAMPVPERLLNQLTATEAKTLLETNRTFSSTLAIRSAMSSGSWRLLVGTGCIVRPGDPIAVVNGSEVIWSRRKAKGAVGAYITKAELVEVEVMGEPTLQLTIMADVVWQGAAKGRQSVKAMLVPMAATGTELLEEINGQLIPFEAAFVSDGLVKVTQPIRKIREGAFTVRRACTQTVFDHLRQQYADDSRYSFDEASLTVSFQGMGWLAEIAIGVESQPVHEAIGDASMMLTQAAVLGAADHNCDGAGSAVLRDLLLDRVADRVALLRYAKANNSVTAGRLPLPDGSHLPVTGWVEYQADGTLAGPQRGFADESGHPAVAAEFSANDSDVEVLIKMAERYPWVIVRTTDETGETHVASIHCPAILKLAGQMPPSGQFGGIGHTSAELLRCVLFPERSRRLAGPKERAGLIRKWRRQLAKLAFSPALNRVHKVKIGVSAKAIADWCTPEDVVVLHPNGEPAQRLARHFGCRVQELEGRHAIVARHPVAACYVAVICLDQRTLEPCVLVNEMSWRTRLLGDTDGDAINLFPIRDDGLAKRLSDGLEALLPGGDVCMAVTGISGSHPAHKLFGELVKARPVDALLDKSVTKPAIEWQRQLDEQVHTATMVCGSTYRVVEWSAYLAGLGAITADAAMVGTFLYEHRGLAGEAVSDASKEHLRLWAQGIRNGSLGLYGAAIDGDLSHGMPGPVQIDDQALLGLVVASEMNRIAKSGGIPRAEDGSGRIDRLGGEHMDYEPLWRFAALLQAIGRGDVAKSDSLLVDFPQQVGAASSGGFLFDLVDLVVRSLGPVVQALSDEGVYGQQTATFDGEGWSDGFGGEVEDDFDVLPDWAV